MVKKYTIYIWACVLLGLFIAEVAGASDNNLLKNPGFEETRKLNNFELPKGWYSGHWYTPTGGDNITLSYNASVETPVYEGQKSLKLMNVGQEDGRFRSDIVKVQPAKEYIFSFVYNYKNMVGRGDITLTFVTEEGKPQEDGYSPRVIFDREKIVKVEGKAIHDILRKELNDNWAKIEIKFSVPGGIFKLIVCPRISKWGNERKNAYVYVDDFVLSEATKEF